MLRRQAWQRCIPLQSDAMGECKPLEMYRVIKTFLLTFWTIFDDCIDEKDLEEDDDDCEVICCDFWTELEEDICCWLLKEFCWLFTIELLIEFSCFWLNKLLFSWRGAAWNPACWKGVPTLRTSSAFSSEKLVSCCFISRFREEFCSTFEKLTVAPRCWKKLVRF